MLHAPVRETPSPGLSLLIGLHGTITVLMTIKLPHASNLSYLYYEVYNTYVCVFFLAQTCKPPKFNT